MWVVWLVRLGWCFCGFIVLVDCGWLCIDIIVLRVFVGRLYRLLFVLLGLICGY